MFVRTATNDQLYHAVVKGLKSNVNEVNKDLSEALIKNETYRYENRNGNYKSRNSGNDFPIHIKGMINNVDFNLPIIETVER